MQNKMDPGKIIERMEQRKARVDELYKLQQEKDFYQLAYVQIKRAIEREFDVATEFPINLFWIFATYVSIRDDLSLTQEELCTGFLEIVTTILGEYNAMSTTNAQYAVKETDSTSYHGDRRKDFNIYLL